MKIATPTPYLSPGLQGRRAENMATLSEGGRRLVFPGKAGASVCRKREENFSEASSNTGEFASNGV